MAKLLSLSRLMQINLYMYIYIYILVNHLFHLSVSSFWPVIETYTLIGASQGNFVISLFSCSTFGHSPGLLSLGLVVKRRKS